MNIVVQSINPDDDRSLNSTKLLTLI